MLSEFASNSCRPIRGFAVRWFSQPRVSTGFHPWLQHAVPPGLLSPKGGATNITLKKMSASERKATLAASPCTALLF